MSTLALGGALLLSLLPYAVAQTTNATCLPQFSWMNNKLGQNPCLVTAYLGSVCNGGQYAVPALNPGSHYVGPTAAQSNTCQCSSVLYSTISACGICQNGSSIVSWTGWDLSCGSVSVGLWPNPIPDGTSVPAWAYIDVSQSNMFDPVQAQTIASENIPESTATGHQSTIRTGGTSGGATPTGSPLNTGTPTAKKSSSNAGAIAGGVVGGIVALLVLGLLAFWFIKKRNAANHTPASAEFTKRYSIDGVAPPPAGPPMAQPWQQPAPVLYDPNNPLTFPASPAPPSAYSGYPVGGAPYGTPPPQRNTGQYQGIAEI